MTEWNVSESTAAFVKHALVWDMCLPWSREVPDRSIDVLRRYQDSGFDFVCLAVAGDRAWLDDTVRCMGEVHAWVAADRDVLTPV